MTISRQRKLEKRKKKENFKILIRIKVRLSSLLYILQQSSKIPSCIQISSYLSTIIFCLCIFIQLPQNHQLLRLHYINLTKQDLKFIWLPFQNVLVTNIQEIFSGWHIDSQQYVQYHQVLFMKYKSQHL